jgi:CRP-like cAMP-binding protein
MNYAVNHLPNEYFFAAATPIAVRQAPEREVMDFVRSNPEIALYLLSGAYEGMDGAMRRQMLLMGSGSAERLVYEIIETCHRLGKELADGSFELRMNETELATQVGLARETVSRQLQALKEKKLVSIMPHLMIISDLDALEALIRGGAS